MTDFDGKEVQDEFNKVFGNLELQLKTPDGNGNSSKYLTINDLTAKQLWWLTKFAKHVRGRCRSNAAFNNYMNRNFSPARFDSVQKEYKGRTYQGLKITANEESIEEESND